MHSSFRGLAAQSTAGLLALAFGSLLAGCAAAPAAPAASAGSVAGARTPVNPGVRGNAPDPGGWAQWLQAYRWQLAAATRADGAPVPGLVPRPDRALELSFTADRIGVQGGCNGMGGAYQVSPSGRMTVSQLLATRRACEPALMQTDAAVSAALAGPVQLSAEATPPTPGGPPRLRLATADGSLLTWTGQPTPESRFGGPGTLVFMEVAARRVPCAHPLIRDATCLQVRDRAYDAQGLATGTPGPWQPLFGDIEGYTHTDGVRNVLRVKRFERATPMPADVSSRVLVLDMVVETEATGP